jgi:hypothetical protein
MSTGQQLELWAEPPERRRQRRAELRRRVFEVYGRACRCCGSVRNLTLDHIDGNGAQHRRELFGRQTSGVHLYAVLVRKGCPPGYQTLCAPCNRSKGSGDRCRIDHAPLTDARPAKTAGPVTTP